MLLSRNMTHTSQMRELMVLGTQGQSGGDERAGP